MCSDTFVQAATMASVCAEPHEAGGGVCGCGPVAPTSHFLHNLLQFGGIFALGYFLLVFPASGFFKVVLLVTGGDGRASGSQVGHSPEDVRSWSLGAIG